MSTNRKPRPSRPNDMTEAEFRQRLLQIQKKQNRGGIVRTIIMIVALIAIAVFYGLRSRAPQVLSMTTATALDAEFRPMAETDTFGREDTFFVSVEISGYRAGMDIAARWYFAGEQIRETPLTTEYSGDGWLGFLLMSEDLWPEGVYRVEIVYDDDVLSDVAFKVEDPGQ